MQILRTADAGTIIFWFTENYKEFDYVSRAVGSIYSIKSMKKTEIIEGVHFPRRPERK